MQNKEIGQTSTQILQQIPDDPNVMLVSSVTYDSKNGWPNPDKPGVPVNADRDGWHWLRRTNSLEAEPWHWSVYDDPEGCWSTDNGGEDGESMAGQFDYHGPAIPPAELTERLVRAVDELPFDEFATGDHLVLCSSVIDVIRSVMKGDAT